MGESRSILIDLDITADLFKEAELFQEQCLDAAERLASIMRGNEIPAEKLCREMIKAAAAKTKPLTPDVVLFKKYVNSFIENPINIPESSDEPGEWTNEALAQLHQVLTSMAESVQNDLNERLLMQDGGQIIRSKKMASYLYKRLRVFHDKWRKAMNMMDPEKQWKVINGMPGNYTDGFGPMFIYMFRNEEYTFHHYILRTLQKEAENFDGGEEPIDPASGRTISVALSEIKTVADFHDFVRANPECGVVIHEVP